MMEISSHCLSLCFFAPQTKENMVFILYIVKQNLIYRFSRAKSEALLIILVNKNLVMLNGEGNENGIKINRSN